MTSKKEAKKAAEREQIRKNLGIAAAKWNRMSEAEKDAVRRWGTGTPPPSAKKTSLWKKIFG